MIFKHQILYEDDIPCLVLEWTGNKWYNEISYVLSNISGLMLKYEHKKNIRAALVMIKDHNDIWFGYDRNNNISIPIGPGFARYALIEYARILGSRLKKVDFKNDQRPHKGVGRQLNN